MDITAPDYAPGSGIDRHPKNVAPMATFAGDDPVTSSHFGMSDAAKPVSLGYSDGLRAVDAMRSSIIAYTIAINSDALRIRARNHTWRQFRKEHGAGYHDERYNFIHMRAFPWLRGSTNSRHETSYSASAFKISKTSDISNSAVTTSLRRVVRLEC